MQAKLIAFIVLCASMAFGQDATESRVFRFHHIAHTKDLQEVAVLIRTLSDIKDQTVDEGRKTISVTGSPMQIRTAEWLYLELDRQTLPTFATKEFKVPNKEDDVARVFFLTNEATPQSFQEVATSVRTVTEMRRVFTANFIRAMAVRGTADQLAATEFLVRELDQPAEAKRADSREYQMIDSNKRNETALRVFYLPYTATAQQFQEIATLVRTIAETRLLFTVNATKALIVRGTPDQVKLTDWIVHELGKPVTADASQPYDYPDLYRDHEHIVRVFYVKDARSVKDFQQIVTQIRTATKMRRVFTYNASYALAVRGTEAQIAQAKQILDDRQVALK